MSLAIGKLISALRKRLGLTQDQFGAVYGVSGPAIYKFEKGYVNPSLQLWMKFSHDSGLSEKQAALLWCKGKLSEQHSRHIPIDDEGNLTGNENRGSEAPEWLQITDRVRLRKAVVENEKTPAGLRNLVLDDDFWIVFKPTGAELHAVEQKFGAYRNAPSEAFADALRNIRIFFRQGMES